MEEFKREKQQKNQEKAVLFRTEDGKKISLYDIFFFVGSDYSIKEYVAQLEHLSFSPMLKCSFSTRRVAEEYVIENKPCLSLAEYRFLTQLNYTNYYEKNSRNNTKHCFYGISNN